MHKQRAPKVSKKPEGEQEFTVTWKDLVDPKDRENVTTDIDNAQPYSWSDDQAQE